MRISAQGWKKGGVPPHSPHDALTAAVSDAGVGVMFRCDVLVDILRGNMRRNNPTISDALKEDFLQ